MQGAVLHAKLVVADGVWSAVGSSNFDRRSVAWNNEVDAIVLGADTDLTRLPWTGHRVRRWEPEPARWLGVHALYRLYRAADRREDAGMSRTSHIARVAHRVAGR